MLNKLVTDADVNITVDEYDGWVEIFDETNFTIARVNCGMVESVELTVKEAAKLSKELGRFVGRHSTRLRTVKARAAKIKGRAK